MPLREPIELLWLMCVTTPLVASLTWDVKRLSEMRVIPWAVKKCNPPIAARHAVMPPGRGSGRRVRSYHFLQPLHCLSPLRRQNLSPVCWQQWLFIASGVFLDLFFLMLFEQLFGCEKTLFQLIVLLCSFSSALSPHLCCSHIDVGSHQSRRKRDTSLATSFKMCSGRTAASPASRAASARSPLAVAVAMVAEESRTPGAEGAEAETKKQQSERPKGPEHPTIVNTYSS